MMHNTSWDDLRYLLTVANTGSVNAAARQLGVNHATVLRRLAAFEARTGTALFRKSPQGYVLEPRFADAMDILRVVEDKVDAFSRAIVSNDDRLSGEILVTSTDTLCDFVLPEIVRDILAIHPDLRIHLSVSNTHVNLAKLDAELTIRPALRLPADLNGRAVGVLGLVPYATAGYLAKYDTPDPEKHRWLLVDGPLLNSPIGAWQANLPDQAIVGTATSFPTLMALAASGMGVAFLPCCIGDPCRDLVRVTQLDLRFETRLWVATHTDLADNPRLKAVSALFESAFMDRGRMLSGD